MLGKKLAPSSIQQQNRYYTHTYYGASARTREEMSGEWKHAIFSMVRYDQLDINQFGGKFKDSNMMLI
jgi:hypothetical protein